MKVSFVSDLQGDVVISPVTQIVADTITSWPSPDSQNDPVLEPPEAGSDGGHDEPLESTEAVDGHGHLVRLPVIFIFAPWNRKGSIQVKKSIHGWVWVPAAIILAFSPCTD